MSQLRVALRTLGRHRGFTAVAVLSLSVAIALNTTMYSVLDTLLDVRINVREPERVHSLSFFGDRRMSLSPGIVEQALSAGLRSYQGVTGAMASARQDGTLPLAENGNRYRRVNPRIVRPNYFSFLGTMPVQGRTFLPTDEGTAVAVISARLARHLFDGAPAIGKTFTLEGQGLTVVGIIEPYPGYRPISGDVWMLRPAAAAEVPISLIRFRDDADFDAVKTELAVVSARLALANGVIPELARFHLRRIDLARQLGQFHKALMGAVLAVLLVACANLANLQLARGLARRRDLAVRAAVGASRRQIVNHLLVESGILAAAGLIVGVILTVWSIAAVNAYIPPEIDGYLVAPKTSWRMFAFATAAAMVCLFLVGLLPALHVSRVDPNTMLKSGGGTGANRQHRRRYGAMVVAQIAFALPVLIGSIVALKGALRLHSSDFLAREWFGFDPVPIVSSGIALQSTERTPRAVRLSDLAGDVTSRARRVAGVTDAAAEFSRQPVKRMVTVEDDNGQIREMMAHQWSYSVVSPAYFRVYGRAMERGRDFREGEFDGRSVIMDAPSARLLWGNRDPLGRSIKLASLDTDAPWLKVVGIVGDMRDTFAIRRYKRDANFRLYEVYRVITPQDSAVLGLGQRSTSMTIHARARGNTELAAIRLQRELRSLSIADRPTAVPLVWWLSTLRVQQDFVASLFGIFGAIGLGLVAIGVYGIVAQSIAERRRELAVRISLGATARNILHSVLREGNVLVLLGIAIGLLLTRQSVWWLGPFVDDDIGYDAILFALIATWLFALAAFAAFIPAWRATRIDPVEALRHE